MSRIGKAPIKIPAGVECKLVDSQVTIKGPKGELARVLPPNIKVDIQDGVLSVTRSSDERSSRAYHGLARTLINNMIVGVTKGFSKTLSIVGVGFKVDLKGKDLALQLGFSHPVEIPAPPGIKFEADAKNNVITITGIDKEKVGQITANIRKIKPPEPYKGKGIMYMGEKIIRKAGKAAATTKS